MMPLYGVQPVTERRRKKEAGWIVMGPYVIRATGRLLLSHRLLNMGVFDMQTWRQSSGAMSCLFMGARGAAEVSEKQTTG